MARSGRAQQDDTMLKRALTELGSTWRAQTWSVGIFFQARKNGMVYFAVVTSDIYRGSSFSDRNKKMGTDRVRVHLESSNLVCRHIF